MYPLTCQPSVLKVAKLSIKILKANQIPTVLVFPVFSLKLNFCTFFKGNSNHVIAFGHNVQS